MCPPFASLPSFLDPPLTSDGKVYAHERVNEIIRQCYLITRFCHTPYSDVMDMSPMERETILNIIREDKEKELKANQEIAKKIKGKKK